MPKGRKTMPTPPTFAHVLEAGSSAEDFDATNIALLTAQRIEGSRGEQMPIRTFGGEIDTVGGSVICGSVHTNGQAIATDGGSLDLGTGDIQQQGGPFGRAAYVDPETGTLADVVASLVEAGLMSAP
jgi:hypothetical protein